MQTPIRIAVLSDLHVGDGARSQDLSPKDKPKKLEKNHRKRFLKFLKEADLRADYLLVPGDLSDSANPAELQLGCEVLQEIAQVLHVENSRILYVPGNHDVDWSVLKGPQDTTGLRLRQRFDPISAQPFLAEITAEDDQSLIKAPHFRVWEFPNLVVIGYNSACADGPKKRIHTGTFRQVDLDSLEGAINGLNLSDERIRVFMLHHHPVQYSDPSGDHDRDHDVDVDGNESDFSILGNAERLLQFLSKHRFDIVVHGHKHVPKFHTTILDARSPLAILCAGSFSIQLDSRWSGVVTNQFHLIEVDARDPQTTYPLGKVFSWSFTQPNGWQPSDVANGINYEIPFGVYPQLVSLRTRVRDFISPHVKPKTYVDFADVLEAFPELHYVPHDLIHELVDEVGQELLFRRQGNLPGEVYLICK